MSVDAWPEHEPDWDTESDIGNYHDPYDDEQELRVQAGRDLDQSWHHTEVRRDAYNAQSITIIQQSVADKVRASLRHYSAEYLAEQTVRYVPPAGLQERAIPFARDRVLVLLCPVGVERCGQRAAAAFLVACVNADRPDKDRLALQRPLLDERLELEDTLTDERQVALFFDLVSSREDVPDRLDQFGLLQRKLAGADGFAVLAVSEVFEDEVAKVFPGRCCRLGRPPGEAVFRLRAASLPDLLLEALVADESVAKELENAWPPAAAELAKHAVRAHRAGITAPGKVLEQLKQERGNWADRARRDLESHRAGPERALMLSAALLEGAEPATIVGGGELLLALGRYSAEPTHPLESPGVVTALGSLADLEFDPLSRTFGRPGYGSALLYQIWHDHPPLQDLLRRWFDRLPAAVRPAETVKLAERIIELAERTGNGAVAVSVARRWAVPRPVNATEAGRSPAPGSGADRRRRAAALQLLTLAAVNADIGADVRRRMYEHVYDRPQSFHVRSLMAEATGAFAETYPAVALTRLKYLASSPEPEIVTLVVTALTRVAGVMSINSFIRAMTDWLRGDSPAQAEVAAEAIADAGISRMLLVADAGTLVRFWQTALATLPAELSARLIRSWLFIAAEATDAVDVVGVLLTATDGDLRRIGLLLYATRPPGDGFFEQGAVSELFSRVRIRLDELTVRTTDQEREV